MLNNFEARVVMEYIILFQVNLQITFSRSNKYRVLGMKYMMPFTDNIKCKIYLSNIFRRPYKSPIGMRIKH